MYRIALVALLALPLNAALFAVESGENLESKPPMMAMNSMCPMCTKGIGEHPMLTRVTVGDGATATSFMIGMDTKEFQEAFQKDPETGMKKTFGKDAAGPKTLYK